MPSDTVSVGCFNATKLHDSAAPLSDPLEVPFVVEWESQTDEPHDPLAIVLKLDITIGDKTIKVKGTFDTGADITELEPPHLDDFGVDEDACGFTQLTFPDGSLDTEPLVMATASFLGHEFPMPVSLLKYPRRAPKGTPINVFGRAGLMDHFRIEVDPAKGVTAFWWVGKSPKSRLDDIQEFFINDRIGKAKAHQRGAQAT